jgi:dTDP-4-dehydrorhamnose 3,5-epimerase
MRSLEIAGSFIVEHQVHGDSRGNFREWYKKSEFEKAGIEFQIAQANYSFSAKGVLRGLHFSIAPQGQSKLVTCAYGEILDVIVDLRLNSPTFLRVEKIKLTPESGDVLYIPSGVGHSFLVKSDNAAVTYLTSSEYDPENEKTIFPLDPELGVDWPSIAGVNFSLSSRDETAPTLSEAKLQRILPTFAS